MGNVGSNEKSFPIGVCLFFFAVFDSSSFSSVSQGETGSQIHSKCEWIYPFH